MLTIHTPIGLTVDASILQLNDNFTERITGNYQMIGNGLEPEDMLHFLSGPPEVYLAEGGMTALIDNKTIYENRNLKLDVINNVLNRILVADTYQMTYQDQVFIQSVLKKMGVSDVQEFIRQIQNIRQESKNVSYLTDLYWAERETVSGLLEYRQMQAEQGESRKEENEAGQPENVLWLHQEILNRLKTGAVYQELRNYISTAANYHQVISRAEMQISEQTVTAQNILLNKLRNTTMMEEQPLIYHYINAYEMGGEISVHEDYRRMMSQVVQAVLLNALHQMYALRKEELLRQDNVWYQLAGTVYQAAENTFRRFADYHEQNFLTVREADIYSKKVQQYQNNEMQAIIRLFMEDRQNTINYMEAGNPAEEVLLHRQPEGAEEEQPETAAADRPEQVIRRTEKLQEYGRQLRWLTKQESLLKERLEQIQRVPQYQDSENRELWQLFTENLQNTINYTEAGKPAEETLLHRQPEGAGEEQPESRNGEQPGQEPRNIQNIQLREQQLQALTRQELRLENRQNTITYAGDGTPQGERLTYLQPEDGNGEQPESRDGEQPGQELRNIQNIELHGQQIQALTRQELQLKNQLEQINQNNIRSQQLLQQLSIQGGEHREPGRIDRAKAREDALQAISQPEQVLMTYLESRTTEEQQNILEKERLTQIFGEDTVRIFETLEKYQKTPELMIASGQVVPDGTEMLLRDIQIRQALESADRMPEPGEMVHEELYETQTRQLLQEHMQEQVRQVRRDTGRQIDRVELVHRQEENTLEEEMLEEIRGLHRTAKVENEQTTEQIIERNTTQEIINNRVQEFQTQQNEELVRILTDKMQRQLGSLSEQVYGKLEKRMDTERRRRGL